MFQINYLLAVNTQMKRLWFLNWLSYSKHAAVNENKHDNGKKIEQNS